DARDRAADRPGADGRDSAHGGTTGDIEALSMRAGLGGVTSEQAGQFFRAAECRAVASGDLIGNDAQALGGHAAHEPSREEAVSVHRTSRVGMAGQAPSGHGRRPGVSDCARYPLVMASSARARGTSWKKQTRGSWLPVLPPSRAAC